MNVFDTAWNRVDHASEPIGHAGHACFLRFVHEDIGAVLYLFWNWKHGWYLEMQWQGRKELVVLYGTDPGQAHPRITRALLLEAERIAKKWEMAR